MWRRVKGLGQSRHTPHSSLSSVFHLPPKKQPAERQSCVRRRYRKGCMEFLSKRLCVNVSSASCFTPPPNAACAQPARDWSMRIWSKVQSGCDTGISHKTLGEGTGVGRLPSDAELSEVGASAGNVGPSQNSWRRTVTLHKQSEHVEVVKEPI